MSQECASEERVWVYTADIDGAYTRKLVDILPAVWPISSSDLLAMPFDELRKRLYRQDRDTF